MNEKIKQTIEKLKQLPKGEKVITMGDDGWRTHPDFTTNDLHELAEYVEKANIDLGYSDERHQRRDQAAGEHGQ